MKSILHINSINHKYGNELLIDVIDIDVKESRYQPDLYIVHRFIALFCLWMVQKILQ